ncbi:MAG: Transposase IS4 family protein [Microgenomates group bacterium GW2011_GWC2_46_7]|nr:MAG: Transposase IS4 family protein [Microgenomates group bacterium GW2011_GWC2_46_7]
MQKNDYINFLIHTPLNYTATTLADHKPDVSHDAVSDFLSHSRSTASSVWELSRTLISDLEEGFLIADDSVQSKPYAEKIGLVKLQYSGAVHGLVKGIGIVNLVHSDGKEYYPVDFRMYAPDTDGKTKNDHFLEMLQNAKQKKGIKAKTVLMDSWYASVDNLKAIHRMGMIFFTTLKENRLVSQTKEGGYVHLEDLVWSDHTLEYGMVIKLKESPFKVKLFRMVAIDGHVDWLITNHPDRNLKRKVVKDKNNVRWQIEQFHREVKNTTGSEKCQSRNPRSQRNHISYCYQAWLSLKVVAKQTQQTVYQLKTNFLDAYLNEVMQNSIVPVFTGG